MARVRANVIPKERAIGMEVSWGVAGIMEFAELKGGKEGRKRVNAVSYGSLWVFSSVPCY